jgi:hypothetical protein
VPVAPNSGAPCARAAGPGGALRARGGGEAGEAEEAEGLGAGGKGKIAKKGRHSRPLPRSPNVTFRDIDTFNWSTNISVFHSKIIEFSIDKHGQIWYNVYRVENE